MFNLKPRAVVLSVTLSLLASCGPKPLVVRPADPVMPVCLIIPDRLLVDKPPVILSPSSPSKSTPGQKLNCRMPSAGSS